MPSGPEQTVAVLVERSLSAVGDGPRLFRLAVRSSLVVPPACAPRDTTSGGDGLALPACSSSLTRGKRSFSMFSANWRSYAY